MNQNFWTLNNPNMVEQSHNDPNKNQERDQRKVIDEI